MTSTDDSPLRLRSFDRKELKTSLSSIQWDVSGRVTDLVGTVVEANLPNAHLGNVVDISVPGQTSIQAEVVGFKDDKSLLLPYTTLTGLSPGCLVRGARSHDRIDVGPHLLGKVLDPMMNVLNETTPFNSEHLVRVPLEKSAPNPLTRSRIENTLSLGVRAMDSMLTFGEGQRIGIMAGSGVGKSVLMGMIARGSESDVNVIGLIGERGREVREFIERDLGPEGLAKSVVVVVTSDQSPLMRIRGAKVVTSIAEYFSSIGKRVLLMMDSLTRVAMAQREIGLAIGEPPTTKGYPPSTFSLLPRLLERCGPQADGHGSISGLYTVLVDGDDFNDPLPDAARSILDGHINLSRRLAARGQFPAIEVSSSVSRVMHDIVDSEHWELAQSLRALIGVYEENYDYVQIGSYQAGSNPKMDQALQLMPAIENMFKQRIDEHSTMEMTLERMRQIFSGRTDMQQAG